MQTQGVFSVSCTPVGFRWVSGSYTLQTYWSWPFLVREGVFAAHDMASKDLWPQFVGQWGNLLLQVQLILHLVSVRADTAVTPVPIMPI